RAFYRPPSARPSRSHSLGLPLISRDLAQSLVDGRESRIMDVSLRQSSWRAWRHRQTTKSEWCRRGSTRARRYGLALFLVVSDFDGRYPSFRASASVMNLPSFVLPYHLSPS